MAGMKIAADKSEYFRNRYTFRGSDDHESNSSSPTDRLIAFHAIGLFSPLVRVNYFTAKRVSTSGFAFSAWGLLLLCERFLRITRGRLPQMLEVAAFSNGGLREGGHRGPRWRGPKSRCGGLLGVAG